MTIPAQSIIRRCVETLQDVGSVRWPINELVRYLNDGQREVGLHRPDATATLQTVACVPGARQTLPPAAVKLIEVVRNAAGGRRAVRMASQNLIDAHNPGWYNMPGTLDVMHFMFDPREPRVFHVYPPALAATQLEVVFSVWPTDVPEPADSAPLTAVTGNIGVPAIFGNALQDYILARAYTKDAEFANNGQRAQAHYTAFMAALTGEARATVGIAPVAGQRTTG